MFQIYMVAYQRRKLNILFVQLIFNPLNNQKYLNCIKNSKPHEKFGVVILEKFLLFLGNNLSLLRKSEETLLVGETQSLLM